MGTFSSSYVIQNNDDVEAVESGKSWDNDKSKWLSQEELKKLAEKRRIWKEKMRTYERMVRTCS